MIRNIIISIISAPILYCATIFSFEPSSKLISLLFRMNDGVPIELYGLLILSDFYIIGLLFIKSTGKKSKDILSVGSLGILLLIVFLITTVVSGPNPWEPNLIVDLSITGIFFVCCFLPSLFLWLGMFSRKKNRVKLKDASLKRKIQQTGAEEGRKDENPPPVPTA